MDIFRRFGLVLLRNPKGIKIKITGKAAIHEIGTVAAIERDDKNKFYRSMILINLTRLIHSSDSKNEH